MIIYDVDMCLLDLQECRVYVVRFFTCSTALALVFYRRRITIFFLISFLFPRTDKSLYRKLGFCYLGNV